jgi:ferredoxin-NADP reductase
LFHFVLPNATSATVPVGQHIRVKTVVGGSKLGIKPYTPINDDSETTCFDLLIKIYPDGFVSSSFASTKVGDQISFSISSTDFDYQKVIASMDNIGMLAGGKATKDISNNNY